MEDPIDRAGLAPSDSQQLDALVRAVARASHRHSGPLALDDLVQIGRVAAEHAVATHDGREPGLRAYVAQAIRWRIQDAYRRELREPQPAATIDEYETATESLVRQDDADAVVRRLDLHRAMRQLRPDYRRLLFDLKVLDRSFRDVAAERRISPGAVKSLQHRALEQLRQLEDAA